MKNMSKIAAGVLEANSVVSSEEKEIVAYGLDKRGRTFFDIFCNYDNLCTSPNDPSVFFVPFNPLSVPHKKIL